MTKDELIEKISAESKLTKEEVSTIINAFFNEIKTKLSQGQRVDISGFGSFILTEPEK